MNTSVWAWCTKGARFSLLHCTPIRLAAKVLSLALCRCRGWGPSIAGAGCSRH